MWVGLDGDELARWSTVLERLLARWGWPPALATDDIEWLDNFNVRGLKELPVGV